MQQFTVPQFIDVEDKIIGPITVRQFIILIVAGLILFLEYKLSDITFFIFLAIPTGIVFGTIAFARVNGMPFHYFVIHIIETLKKPALRTWQRERALKEAVKTKAGEAKVAATPAPTKAPVTRSRLSDISLLIDTGGVYRGEE